MTMLVTKVSTAKIRETLVFMVESRFIGNIKIYYFASKPVR